MSGAQRTEKHALVSAKKLHTVKGLYSDLVFFILFLIDTRINKQNGFYNQISCKKEDALFSFGSVDASYHFHVFLFGENNVKN